MKTRDNETMTVHQSRIAKAVPKSGRPARSGRKHRQSDDVVSLFIGGLEPRSGDVPKPSGDVGGSNHLP